MPAHLHPALLCCATLSLAAHAVLLDALDLTPDVRRQVGGAAEQGAVNTVIKAGLEHTSTAATLRFRTIHASAPPHAAPSLAEPILEPMPAPVPNEAPSEGPAEAHAEPVAAQASPPDTSEITTPPLVATAPSPDPLPGPSTDAYIPRPQLSIAPVAQTPVLLSAPKGQRKATRRVGVLALYIDEAGRVHHIEPDEPRLPPDFERVARDAFMHTVFTPGQVDGRIVKSRIRVEVVFDNTPLDDAAPQGSL